MDPQRLSSDVQIEFLSELIPCKDARVPSLILEEPVDALKVLRRQLRRPPAVILLSYLVAVGPVSKVIILLQHLPATSLADVEISKYISLPIFNAVRVHEVDCTLHPCLFWGRKNRR